jgi:hypothetical protein
MNKSIKLLCGLAVVSSLAASVGIAQASTSRSKLAPLCVLGQTTKASAPCRANPDFSKAACAKFAASVTLLTGSPVVVGPNRSAPSGLNCFYQIGGRTQTFRFAVFKGATSKSSYAFELKEKQDWPAKAASGDMPGCFGDGQNETPVNAPTILSGIGDKAFSWDQCSDGYKDSSSEAYAIKGTVFSYVGMSHYTQANPTAAELLPYLKHLIATYH